MPGPFNMPPFPDGAMNFGQFDMDPHEKAKMAGMFSLLMEDIKNHEEGNVAPDTIGADYFFIQNFVTGDMEWDFDRIEEDFMKHCYDKLREFGRVQWYEHNAARFSTPEESHRNMVMGLILNGAKSGDEYCKALIRYLFKTYHKQLYKQLKRFSKISLDEVLALSRPDDDDDLDMGYMAIVLTMCSIDNVVMQDRCTILYRYLDKRREEYDLMDEEANEFMDFADGLFEDCQRQVEEWVSAEEKSNVRHLHKEYWKEDAFVGRCLNHLGYPEDYLYRCMENNMGLKIQFTRTLAVLRTVYPKREFTYEEVQRYTHLYSAISSLVDVSENLDDLNRMFLGLEQDYDDWDDETLFHPENITVSNQPKSKAEKKVLTNVATVDNSSASKDDYLAEIDELHKKLNQREMEYKQLKAQYSAAHVARKEAENRLAVYESDREELIALREFAYHLENEAPVIAETSIDDMKKAIADKAYVIIGGHVNWVNKLKSEFPKWTFILPSAYKTVDADGLDNKDKIFFFTDHISHVAYGKFVAIARERKIPFSYLHGVNMEQIIKQVYESGK